MAQRTSCGATAVEAQWRATQQAAALPPGRTATCARGGRWRVCTPAPAAAPPPPPPPPPPPILRRHYHLIAARTQGRQCPPPPHRWSLAQGEKRGGVARRGMLRACARWTLHGSSTVTQRGTSTAGCNALSRRCAQRGGRAVWGVGLLSAAAGHGGRGTGQRRRRGRNSRWRRQHSWGRARERARLSWWWVRRTKRGAVQRAFRAGGGHRERCWCSGRRGGGGALTRLQLCWAQGVRACECATRTGVERSLARHLTD
jgi:hypothetical protein